MTENELLCESHQMQGIPKFDRKYRMKRLNALSRNIAFTLTKVSFRNLLLAKKCFYTRVKLTTPSPGARNRLTDRTIDRVDPSKGYVAGNVVACCRDANLLKQQYLEGNETHPIDLKGLKHMIERLEARGGDFEFTTTGY